MGYKAIWAALIFPGVLLGLTDADTWAWAFWGACLALAATAHLGAAAVLSRRR